METGTLNRRPSISEEISGDDMLFSLELPGLIRKMKHDSTWAQGVLNSRILLKSHQKQVVLIAMHEGTEINSFQSNESVTIQIIEGILRFHTRKENLMLKNGQLVILNEKIAYRLTTREDTLVLLTIINSILQHVED
jgi:quercetin dioxygenase-like cupin family protein